MNRLRCKQLVQFSQLGHSHVTRIQNQNTTLPAARNPPRPFPVPPTLRGHPHTVLELMSEVSACTFLFVISLTRHAVWGRPCCSGAYALFSLLSRVHLWTCHRLSVPLLLAIRIVASLGLWRLLLYEHNCKCEHVYQNFRWVYVQGSVGMHKSSFSAWLRFSKADIPIRRSLRERKLQLPA